GDRQAALHPPGQAAGAATGPAPHAPEPPSSASMKPRHKHAARQRAKHSKYPPAPQEPASPQQLRSAPAPTSPAPAPPRLATSPLPFGATGRVAAPVAAVGVTGVISPSPAAHPIPLAASASSGASSRPPRPRQSTTWHSVWRALATTYPQLQRQRRDGARNQASALISSHDLLAREDRGIRTLGKHRRLASARADAGWARFRGWVQSGARLQQVRERPVLALAPTPPARGAWAAALVRRACALRIPV